MIVKQISLSTNELPFTTARRGATRDMRVLANRAVYSKLY